MSKEHNKERLKRAKHLQDAVAYILLHDWDPIGVADVPEAQDEYDGYAWQVCGLLLRREPRHKLTEYLWWAETVNMGLHGSVARTERIVDKLLRVPETIGRENPTTGP